MKARARATLRDLLANVLFATGLTRPGRAGAGRLTISTFHRVLPQAQTRVYPLAGLAVTPEELAWFLDFFGRHFTCATLGETASRWSDGEEPPRPFLALTFDDAQRDNFTHAKPILDRAGMRATFFAPVENIDRNEPLWHDRLAFAACRMAEVDPAGTKRFLSELGVEELPDRSVVTLARMVVSRAKKAEPAERKAWIAQAEQLARGGVQPDWDGMMTWEQLAELARAGHEIGSHSMTHPFLSQCSDEEIEREVVGSRRALQMRLDLSIDSFCYPSGDFDARALEAVRRAGYRHAVTSTWGINSRGAPAFQLRRCYMDSEHTKKSNGAPSETRLAWRLSGSHPGLR